MAYSGGRDSTALLHAVLHTAAALGLRVWALHVNHGLSPHADAWQQHGRRLCEQWASQGLPVEFVAQRVAGRPGRGDSIEAWARERRYAALRQMARERDIAVVLLAQHRRDQAETFLLQALRAAGVAGLSGMPRVVQRDGITWMRPWLDVPREAIDAYVLEHGLSHVDDDSNADTRFARNRLRHAVWPALQQAFPGADAALAAAAAWAQQASACLNELAAQDMASVATGADVNLSAWRSLSAPRRGNVLRAWIAERTGQPAPASLVTRLQRELMLPGTARRWPCAGGELRQHRAQLRHVPGPVAADAAPPSAPAPAPAPATATATAPEASLCIRRAGRYRVPGWRGRLIVERVREGGVPLAWLAHVELRPRSGGERFQAGLGRPPRSLKKQFQAAGLPAWERDGPLLYSGGQLVYVPGLGLDARVLALPGQPQVALRWVADSP